MHPRDNLFGFEWLERRDYKYEWLRMVPTQEYYADIEYVSDRDNGENAFSEKRIAIETNDEAPLEEITVDEPCSIEELFQSSHSEYINDKEK